MKSDFRAASASVASRPGEIQENLERMREMAESLRGEDVSLILFPELSISGFLPNHPRIEHEPWVRKGIQTVREWAQPIPGPALDRFVEIARDTGLLLSGGLFEEVGPLVHNSQVLVGPEGILNVTRKMHIPLFEAPFYSGGGLPAVVDTPLGRIGTSICFDAILPESTRLLQIQRAELALFPFASDPEPRTVEGWIENNRPLLQIRCRENGFFGLVCNYSGKVECLGVDMEFPGGGMLIGPDGSLLENWDEQSIPEGRMIADFDSALLDRARSDPEFGPRFRRPELYWPLTEGMVSD